MVLSVVTIILACRKTKHVRTEKSSNSKELMHMCGTYPYQHMLCTPGANICDSNEQPELSLRASPTISVELKFSVELNSRSQFNGKFNSSDTVGDLRRLPELHPRG